VCRRQKEKASEILYVVAAFLKNKQPKPFAAFLCIAWISVRRCVNSSLVPDL